MKIQNTIAYEIRFIVTDALLDLEPELRTLSEWAEENIVKGDYIALSTDTLLMFGCDILKYKPPYDLINEFKQVEVTK